MMKRHEKWISLLVVCTFAWLMHVSTMPVSATEQGPGVYEAAKPKPAPAPKKSILPYVLIGVGVVAVAAVLFLVVLKTNYDITGSWLVTFNNGLQDTYTFVGDKKSGTYTTSVELNEGTYAVDGKNVTMTWTGWTSGWHVAINSWVFAGTFDAKDEMSGTSSGSTAFGPFSNTWTAVKQ